MIFSHVSQFTWISQLFLQNPSAPGMHHNKDDGYDSHTRISYKENPGFFGQIKQSFSAALMGILLVITSFPVIYWNEVKWLPKRIIGYSTVQWKAKIMKYLSLHMHDSPLFGHIIVMLYALFFNTFK